MICWSCGKNIADEAEFCPHCVRAGVPLESGLFVGFVMFFAPQVLPSFRDFRVASAGLLAWFAGLAGGARWWAP